MPLIPIFMLLGGGVAGFTLSSGADKVSDIIKWSTIAAIAFMLYKNTDIIKGLLK